ncbi:MAG: Stp1/IreP family PP2C-type Ser/Thr phosphatase [Lachnospiraceae bacterium]|nr:Stp1/IreP family PP2C-type Ser/Thr phosphatase [Lachnospiraceae bacterium]
MLKTFAMTDVGRRRKLNQDYVFTADLPVGKLPNLYLVADGMGGHKAGGFASRYAVETMVEQVGIADCGSKEEILRAAIDVTNTYIRRKAMEDSSMSDMGTTMVAATIEGRELSVVNVGDSRLYVIGDSIRQITSDHSLVEEMVRMGGIDREQARSHPDKNIITRAIGAQKEIEPDFFQVSLCHGDVVLMCSDGLSNMVTDEDMFRIIREGSDLQRKAEALIHAANENGGRDNIAVILIAYEEA